MCPDQPCVRGCPVNIAIPDFIEKITERDYRGAYDVITASNLAALGVRPRLPAGEPVRGRLHGRRVARAVAIGRLERWVGDLAIKEGWSNIPYIEPRRVPRRHRGLRTRRHACPPTWRRRAARSRCTRRSRAGRRAQVRHPDFRLPNSIVDAEIEKLKQLGVRFECNTLVGACSRSSRWSTRWIHAVFIGTGAGYPSFMGIPGENLNGVLSANELLTRCNLIARARASPTTTPPMQPGQSRGRDRRGQYRDDALRVCLRLGADSVSCLYRRSRAEAPARCRGDSPRRGGGYRLPLAGEPGGDPRGRQQERARRALRAHDLGEPDASGRRRPVPEPGSEFEIEADMVVLRDRHQRQPDHRPDLAAQARQAGLHRHRREPGDLESRAFTRVVTSSPAPPR